jgi:hypothetical protein
MPYISTSSKTGKGVRQAAQMMLSILIAARQAYHLDPPLTSTSVTPPAQIKCIVQ